MDRPLSMTELQTIRAALEAADNFAALVELAGSDEHPNELAGMIEHVHRAMAVVDRRITALNRQAVARAKASEPDHVRVDNGPCPRRAEGLDCWCSERGEKP